jgi:hypothetical protein
MLQTDRAYEKTINSLIESAEKKANSEVLKKNYRHTEDYAAMWNAVYHAEMDRLASEAGLRNAKVKCD